MGVTILFSLTVDCMGFVGSRMNPVQSLIILFPEISSFKKFIFMVFTFFGSLELSNSRKL